jgi:hypothetical protein
VRAISLWQPWASAVVFGTKKIETRHWSTNYRGPLAIHAAKHLVQRELVMWLQMPEFIQALWPIAKDTRDVCELLDRMPFGAIVGTVELVDCVRVETLIELGPLENYLGNYHPGRFGWILEKPIAFETPIPCVGRQGFFHVADEALKAAA